MSAMASAISSSSHRRQDAVVEVLHDAALRGVELRARPDVPAPVLAVRDGAPVGSSVNFTAMTIAAKDNHLQADGVDVQLGCFLALAFSETPVGLATGSCVASQLALKQGWSLACDGG